MKKTKILVIEDNRGDYLILDELLLTSGLNYELSWCETLTDGLQYITNNKIDVLLLDLSLTDSMGLSTFSDVQLFDPSIPVIVITGNTDESVGIEAVKLGAQDYLIKGEVSAAQLARVLKYAIGRKETELLRKNYELLLEKKVNERTAELEQLKNNLEKMVHERTKELQKANAMKDKFFSIMAHDLRSPFNTLSGFLDLLHEEYDDFPDEKRKLFIKKILDTSNQTFSLLENLLEWSRSQRGHIKYNPAKVDVKLVCNEVVGLLEHVAKSKKVEITEQVAESLSAYADNYMIQTVIRNLLTNAIKFSYPGSQVVVSACKNKGDIQVSVADSGKGMEPNTLGNLFKIDVKTTEKGTANEKGSGLGLIICKEFIEKNKGNIWAESKPGKGSKFTFTLPTG